MIFRWLRQVWLWLRRNIFYSLPKLIGSNRDHDSDMSSDEDRSIMQTAYPVSGTEIFDEVDHAPYTPRISPSLMNPKDSSQNAPKGNPYDRGEIFRMKNPYCVVIINIFFENKIGPRNGAQADRENIERLLIHSAGFDSVHVYCDQKRNDILEIMDKISCSAEMANHDGLVVFVSSHGKAKGFQTVDRKIVGVEELTSRVNGQQCKALRGKPKLFFISACRGRKSDPGYVQDSSLIDSDANGDEKLVPKLPTEADFLVCYSTTKSHISYRRFTLGVQNSSPEMGTWLISALTQIFEKNMNDEDIMQMLTRVNATVAKMASRDDHVNGMKQMPVQMHMLRHRVFFGKCKA